jgi:hypothetical protein
MFVVWLSDLALKILFRRWDIFPTRKERQMVLPPHDNKFTPKTGNAGYRCVPQEWSVVSLFADAYLLVG